MAVGIIEQATVQTPRATLKARAVKVFLWVPPEESRHIVMAIKFRDQLSSKLALTLDCTGQAMSEIFLTAVHAIMQVVICSLNNHHGLFGITFC